MTPSSRLSRILPLIAAATCGAGVLSPTYAFHSPRAIGTSLDVLVATENPQAAQATFAHIQNETVRLEVMLSTRIPTSFISQLNQTNDPLSVPKEVIELLSAYQNAHTLTSGIMSPLTGELTARWSRAAKENKLPTDGELKTIVARIRQTTLVINHEASTVQRIGPATLNIDALGKPFILAKATQAAWSNTSLTGLLVNIGGDIMALGSPSAFSPWAIEVTNLNNPADNAAPLATLHMTRAAMVTSGDYARGRTIAGQFVSHILNPLTGQPAGRALAATVLHDDPVIANALATAFCINGPAQATLAEKANAQFLLASREGVQISAQLPLAADAAAPAAPASQPATAPANAWPKGFIASLTLKIVAAGGRPERESVAVWIEDAAGKHVKTLAAWGSNKPNYTKQALSAWSKLNLALRTTASRNAGTYNLDWDGTDQDGKPVTQGKYTLRVEAGSEHGGHFQSKTDITCGADKATATIAKSGAIDASTISYAKPATTP